MPERRRPSSEPQKEFIPHESDRGGAVGVERESWHRRNIRDHFSSFDEPIVDPHTSYERKVKISVHELYESLEKAGSEVVEALAERDSRVDIQTGQRKTIDARGLVSCLEQKGVTVDGDLLKKLLQDHHTYIQRLAFRLASGVSKENLLAFLSTFDEQYDDVWYDSSDRSNPGALFASENPKWYEQFDNLQKEIFSLLGNAIQYQGPSQEERGRFEGIYLSVVKKYIRDHFLGRDRSQPSGNIQQFVDHLVPKEDRFWYIRTVMGVGDYRVSVLKSAFRSLGKFGGAESVRFMKEWVQFYPDALTNEVIDALSTIDAARAANEFLPLLKDKDTAVVRAATRVLHRLEFGRIGISEEGVGYLGKVYDLGEKNNPDYFVQRLTADGQIGVFDEKRKLINHFELTGLDSDEARIKATVLDFTLETLFTPRKDETPEERTEREQALKEFQENYFGFYNNNFFQETDVRFNNLSFKEQGQLLLFYKSASEEEKKRALEFIKQYKEDGFRAFLSLEHGRAMGDAILMVGERLPKEAAAGVFTKYTEIVHATEDVRGYLQEYFSEQLVRDPIVAEHIIENLLRRGKDLLILFAEQSKDVKGKDTRSVVQEIFRQLAHIRTDVLLFASAFREAAKSPEGVALRDVRDIAMESMPASALTDQDREEMRRVFRENREGSYPKRLLDDSLEDFDTALKSSEALFHVLRHKEEMIGFLRFEQRPGGHIYLGSLNVRPETHGSSLGISLMRAAMEQYDDRTMDAVVWENNAASRALLEKIGFRVTSTIENYHGTGETFFTMERPAVVLAKRRAEESELAAA